MKLLSKYGRINSRVMVLLFLVTSCTYYFLVRQVLTSELDQNLSRIQKRMEEYVAIHHALPGEQLLDDLRISYTFLGASKPRPQYSESVQFYDSTLEKFHRFRKLHFGLLVNRDWYEVTLVKPLEGTRHVINIVVFTTIAVIFLIILSFFLVNQVVLQKLWKPFYGSMRILRNFRLDSERSPVFPDSDVDEFSFLNENLRTSLQQASEDYRLLKEFTENASHEIQTPLAIIRSKLDLVIQDRHLSESQSETIRSAYSALTRISRLNQSLLLLTKIENRQFRHVEPVRLKPRLEEKLYQFQELWDNSGIMVTADLEEARLDANPELVDILLNNLLSNATRHNVPDGKLCLRLLPHLLEVSNTGPSLPLDSTRLFRRFYKETPNTQQVGLGLSIVKQIVDTTGMHIHYLFDPPLHVFRVSW